MSENQSSLDNADTKSSFTPHGLAWWITRHRGAVLLGTIIVVLVLAAGVFMVKSEVILQDMFPWGHPYLKLHARFSEVFGSGGSGVAIAVTVKNGDIFNAKTLGKIKAITDEMVLWTDVYRLLTVSIARNSVKVVKTKARGEIVVEALMFPEIPKDDLEMEQLKRNIFSNPAYDGILVAGDGTAALIMTEFKENISYERAFELMQGLVEKYSDENTDLHIVGFPMLMGWIYSYKLNMVAVFAVSIGLILLILFIIFRNFVGMVAPLAIAMISTFAGLGFVGWTGINFSPLLYVLAFLVGARKISHSLQIVCRYMEELADTPNDLDRVCYETTRSMSMPNLSGVLTEVVGFGVLFLAQIALMKQIAVIMSFWMLTVAAASLTPIICTYLPLTRASEKWSRGRVRMSLLDKVCMGTARFCIGSGRYAVIVCAITIVVLCVWKMEGLKVGDPTPGSPLLWPDHPYNQSQALINSKFKASSENLQLYYEGKPESVYDPVVLNTFEQFADHMAEELPDIYKSSSSIIDMVKMINLTLRDGDQIRFQLPTDEVELTGLLGYARQTIGQSVIGRFMDPGLERIQTTLFFADHTSDNLVRIRNAAYGFFKDIPMKVEKGEFKLAGGRVGLEMAVNQEMVESHSLIDGMVLGGICVMCTIFFRSIIAGLMLTLPLLLSNALGYAYMAMNNIGLSINTLPVAAVGAGVGVDFAIYIYSRCIEEFPHQKDWIDTIMMAVRTSGKAVVFTGLTTVSAIITWYFISVMKFQAQMGFFVSMLLLSNMILSLTLHPLLLYMVKPRFISRGAQVKA
jgi:hypothetical protein